MVEVVQTSGMTREMHPTWSVIRYDFPARGVHPPVSLYWYDGGKSLPPEIAVKKPSAAVGVVSENKGSLPARRGPSSAIRSSRIRSRSAWTGIMPRCIQTGRTASSSVRRPSCDFAYAGPFTEAYLLGNIALKVGHRRMEGEFFRGDELPRSESVLFRI